MKFYYEGLDNVSKQMVRGSGMRSVSKAVVRWLDGQRIDAVTVRLAEKKPKRGRAVKQKDLLIPLQELAILTEQGVTLIDALKAVAENDEHPNLAYGFSAISSKIESGQSFSDALSGLFPAVPIVCISFNQCW